MTESKEPQDETLVARLERIETSLNGLVARFETFHANTSKELEGMRMHLYYHSLDWNAFHRSFKSFALDVEDRQRDLIELLLRRTEFPNPHLTVATDHPIAADTVDHLHPRGAARDNTRQPRFVAACEALLGKPLRHLDLGCAGGGLVWDFSQRGHLSIGIEGSDWCRRTQRAEWRTIPERLFTADIRYALRVEDGTGALQRFDVVTAWEVFEHIPEWAVPEMLENVRSHLADDGLLVASVATFQDTDEAGRHYHSTVQTKDWWVAALHAAGLEEVESPFAHGDYPRGSGNPRASDWNAEVQPNLGFHLVARRSAVSVTRGDGGETAAGLGKDFDNVPRSEGADHHFGVRASRESLDRELEITHRLSERCIFVMGHGRSGTSIIQQIINSWPKALLLGESGFYNETRGMSFREEYNRRHVRYGNQICKSTYAPNFLPSDTYYDWLNSASQKYDWMGDKLAFNYDHFRLHPCKKIRNFFESRFFSSKYVFVMRDPIQTLLSSKRLVAAPERAMRSYAVGWAEWIKMWADMVRVFPYTLTIFTDDICNREIGTISEFLKIDLSGAEALLDREERRQHSHADAPSLAAFGERLESIYDAVKMAANGNPILWQADQKLDPDANDSRGKDDAPTRNKGYPLGDVWSRAERFILNFVD